MACAPAYMVRRSHINRTAVTGVLRETEQIRHLALKKDLPVELVEMDFVRDEFVSQVTAQVPAQTILAYQTLIKKLHLLPGDFDIQTFARDKLGKQVGGYYDPNSGAMRIVNHAGGMGTLYSMAERIAGRDIAGEFLLSHEYTHALADQNFNLTHFAYASTNADAVLARRAFIEGDAMLVGTYYAMRKRLRPVAFDPGTAARFEGPWEQWKAIPPVFRRPLLFLYLDGTLFADRIYEARGAAGLDAVYALPPRSSEEILHPSKYFNQDDPPIDVRFETDPPGLQGLAVVDENTLGEIGVQSLLAVPLGWCGAAVAADGWGGDRYRIYRYPGDSGAIGFAWRTVWDTPAERAEFVDNMRRALQKTFPEAGDHAANSGWSWVTDEGVFTLQPEGARGALLTLSRQ
jgi:hypothetical protein